MLLSLTLPSGIADVYWCFCCIPIINDMLTSLNVCLTQVVRESKALYSLTSFSFRCKLIAKVCLTLVVERKGIMLLCCRSFLLPWGITSCDCHFNTVHLPVPRGAAWQFWKSLPLWCHVCAVACCGFVFFWEWSPNADVYLCPVLCPSALKRLFSRWTRCVRQTELKVPVPHVHWFCMLFRVHQPFLCDSAVALSFVGTLSQYWGTHATHRSGSVAKAVCCWAPRCGFHFSCCSCFSNGGKK